VERRGEGGDWNSSEIYSKRKDRGEEREEIGIVVKSIPRGNKIGNPIRVSLYIRDPQSRRGT